jgi:hypothetical protein
MEQRDVHGFVTVRGQHDDFEYALASRSADLPQNLAMQRFMYLARLLGENQYFKRLWFVARLLGGLSQSEVIQSLKGWIERSPVPATVAFRESFPVLAESPAVARGHRMLYTLPDIDADIEQWWCTEVVSGFPVEWQAFGREVYRFEHWSRPVYQVPGAAVPMGWRLDGEEFISEDISFAYAVADELDDLRDGVTAPPAPRSTTYRFRSLRGFHDHLDNHETGAHYFARAELAGSPVGADGGGGHHG